MGNRIRDQPGAWFWTSTDVVFLGIWVSYHPAASSWTQVLTYFLVIRFGSVELNGELMCNEKLIIIPVCWKLLLLGKLTLFTKSRAMLIMDYRYQWLHPSSAVRLEAGYTTCSYIPANRQSILHGQVLSEWFVQRPRSGLPTRWRKLMRRWCKITPYCMWSYGDSSQKKAGRRKPGQHQIERSQ